VQAFAALGHPARHLYDNLKSVVLERVGDHIRFHPPCRVRGPLPLRPQPCAVARQREGPVERTIRYLRDSFFAARRFASLDDLNAQLATWIAETAHPRPRPGDPERRSVALALEEERPRLLPVPDHPFPCDLLRPVVSGKTPYVRFDGNDYSIPYRFVRRPLTLVASDTACAFSMENRTRAPPAPGIAGKSKPKTIWPSSRPPKHHAHELRGRDRLRQACPQRAFIAELARRDLPWLHTHLSACSIATAPPTSAASPPPSPAAP
jgi:hypothetical protein